MMPQRLGCRFTVGEAACLYVVAMEVRRRGACNLYIDQIAAFAGVGRTTCRNALRTARRLGLIRIEERRLSARYNDANRITIISQEWLVWIEHGAKKTVKKPKPTTNQYFNPRQVHRGEGPQRGYRTGQGGNFLPRTAPG